MKFINVGYGNMAAGDRIVTVVSPEAAPIRRLIQDARDAGRAVDATCGHKTRAVLVLDTGSLLLSALQTETLAARLEDQGGSDRDNAHGGWTT